MSKSFRALTVAALAIMLMLSAFAPALAQEGNLFLPLIRSESDAGPSAAIAVDSELLLLSELVVTPTGGELIEIHNPNAIAVDLSNVYVTDATFAGGGTYYYNIVTGSNAGGGGFGDFHALFPDGATIEAGEYQTIALAGSDAFSAEYGVDPTYELYEDGATPDAIPDMREALPGSINNQGGLTNSGEVVILYAWDRASDLVTDLDYALWGDKDEAVDKTGVAIDGPDPDSDTSEYLPDTAIPAQDVIAGGAHAGGASWQRDDVAEGDETLTGGNGAVGHDETSENVSVTWCEAAPTPSAASDCPGSGGPVEVFIHQVQGDGLTSPLEGDAVTIEGIVVGDFIDDGTAGSPNLRGFNVQEEDADADGDPLTSEGVFVYMPAANVNVGDQVRVTGVVKEYVTSGSSLTEIDAVSELVVVASGLPLPAVSDVTLPVSAITDFERYEGMYIRFPQELAISEYFNFDRFNEIVLAWPLDGQDRPYQPTSLVSPGAEANALQAVNDLRRITLDDARTAQNLDPALHPNGQKFTLDNRFRGGDIVQNATGVMDESFGLYRIQPTQGALYTPVNPRSETPDDVGGSLRVASFNVLNYFNGDGQGGGFPTPRGARDVTDFQRQHVKIVSALADLDADIVGLIEIENDEGEFQAVETLLNGSEALGVTGLNELVAPDTYAYIDTDVIGTDEIRQAIIYRTQTVTPLKGYAVLDSNVDPTFLDTKNRPVLAHTFEQFPEGSRFTVAVNHLKSKGSDCLDVGDPDLGDGQGNCNVTRTNAAIALANWLAGDPTESGDPDALVIGDLNAYAMEDPIAALEDFGYTNLMKQFQGALAYSYVFDGQFGYLDHALANGSLLPQITGASAWHINADEPDILDYTTRFKAPNQQELFEENAFRSSDHDPVVAGISPWPACQDVVPSIETLWPVNHRLVDVNILSVAGISNPAVTILSVYQDEPVNGTGDGDTSPDAAGIGSATAQLRAERAGSGNGRVYHVRFLASGEEGACEGAALISVPVSRGKGGAAVDDGDIYDSTVAFAEAATATASASAAASTESPYEGSVPNLFLPMLGAE